jgi:hypothetical protein
VKRRRPGVAGGPYVGELNRFASRILFLALEMRRAEQGRARWGTQFRANSTWQDNATDKLCSEATSLGLGYVRRQCSSVTLNCEIFLPTWSRPRAPPHYYVFDPPFSLQLAFWRSQQSRLSRPMNHHTRHTKQTFQRASPTSHGRQSPNPSEDRTSSGGLTSADLCAAAK